MIMVRVFCLLISGLFFQPCAMGSNTTTIPESFVFLEEVIPSIRISPRYSGSNNFIGKTIDGYQSKRLVLTKPAAEALKQAQEHFQKDGYSIVVYDTYRPQRAVNQFMAWSKDLSDQKMKEQYYPSVNKEKVFELGYIAEKSGHSRGSTIDMSIIPIAQPLHDLQISKRKLKDEFEIPFLDDGTVDMGSSFDLFDVASHYESSLITTEQQQNRCYLKEVMELYGFKNYAEEWWHFTLKDEPYKKTYFDFIVQ